MTHQHGASVHLARQPGEIDLRMVAAATDLARTASSQGTTTQSLLRGLCQAALRVVPADGAGVMLLDGPELRMLHAEPAWVTPMQLLQESFQRGPCHDSMAGHQAVAIEDVTMTRRWPELTRGAVTAGVRAVLSLPIVARDRPWGVLDLYRRDAHAWTEVELSAAGFCVDLATSYLVMAADRERWRSAYLEIEHRSNHDQLTGLPTRELLFDRLGHAILTATRHGSVVVVLFIDIDGFKAVNDTHGHAVGDRVLAEVARRLGLTLRANDTLARLSGDEFVLICEDLSGDTSQVARWVTGLGRRIQTELREVAGPGEAAIEVSVSIGACVSSTGDTAIGLVNRADRAMYEAKRHGGGRLVLGEPEAAEHEAAEHEAGAAEAGHQPARSTPPDPRTALRSAAR
jgi:diguanylate cyclase (GGDEF)-like protein